MGPASGPDRREFFDGVGAERPAETDAGYLLFEPVGRVLRCSGNDTEETDRNIPAILIGMRHTGGNENAVALSDDPEFSIQPKVHFTLQYYLLVLNRRVAVRGNPAFGHQGEPAGDEIWNSVLGSQEYLEGGPSGLLNLHRSGKLH